MKIPRLWKWHRRLRRESGEVYMDRWQLLRTKLLSIYVNRINMPDYDDMPHNHPWRAAWSLKLLRSYKETIYRRGLISGRLIAWSYGRPSRFNRIPEIHRIDEVDQGGAWTLFIGWRADRAWGFVKRDGQVIPSVVRRQQRGVENES